MLWLSVEPVGSQELSTRLAYHLTVDPLPVMNTVQYLNLLDRCSISLCVDLSLCELTTKPGGAKVARNFSYSPATPSYAICSLPKIVRNYKKTNLSSLKIGFSCNICRGIYSTIISYCLPQPILSNVISFRMV